MYFPPKSHQKPFSRFLRQNKLLSCDFVQQGNEQHTRSSCNSVVIHRGAQAGRGLEEGDTSLPAQPVETGGDAGVPPERGATDTRHRSDSRP